MKNNIYKLIILMSCLAVTSFLLAVPAYATEQKQTLPEQITTKILNNHKIAVDNFNVVENDKGDIVLQGTARFYGDKVNAYKEAAKFDVKNIENAITVQPSRSRSDAEITQDVLIQIRMEMFDDYFEDINVAVNDGVVNLNGTVNRLGLIDRVMRDIIWIPGVRDIKNNLELAKYSFADNSIRRVILAKMWDSPNLSPYLISHHPPIAILVNGGHVTLKGYVNNDAAKIIAGHIARSIFGVFTVDNQIVVE